MLECRKASLAERIGAVTADAFLIGAIVAPDGALEFRAATGHRAEPAARLRRGRSSRAPRRFLDDDGDRKWHAARLRRHARPTLGQDCVAILAGRMRGWGARQHVGRPLHALNADVIKSAASHRRTGG
jgi:hypothetical protein